MRAPVAILAGCALAIAWGAQAAAWCDPEWGPCGVSSPSPVSAATPTLREQAASLGLHAVTTVKVGDVTSTEGDTTTYTTVTAQQDAGTFAKKVGSVGSGEESPYDVASSGQRMRTTDGRGVAGDYYANYVVRDGQVVFDRFVFFADDSERARRPVATPAATPIATPEPTPVPPVPSAAPAPASAPPSARPPGGATPPASARPSPRPSSRPVGGRRTPSPDRSSVRAGLALAPAADPLDAIEVLRGRRVELWVRARVDGDPASVVSWRFLGGELVALGPLSGSGDEPLVATWRTVTGDEAPYTVQIRATVRIPGGGRREVDAAIEVSVRSPALVE